MIPTGGRKFSKNSKTPKSKKMMMRGGNSHLPLNPADIVGSLDNTLPLNQNFSKMPNTFPSDYKQGGGAAYGYTGGKDVATFGGSYMPISKMCTAGGDMSRGGNNFGMNGGGRGKTRKNRKQSRSPTRASIAYSRRKSPKKSMFSFKTLFSRRKSKSNSGGAKRKNKKKGSQKLWTQKGCNKMGGGSCLGAL